MNKISLWKYRNEGADNRGAVLVAVMRFSEEKSQSKGSIKDLFRDYFFKKKLKHMLNKTFKSKTEKKQIIDNFLGHRLGTRQ